MRGRDGLPWPWLVCSLLACGKTGTGTGSGGPILLDDLKTAYVDSLCRLYVRCEVSPDKATCVTSFDWSSIDAIVEAIRAGRIQYDGGAAAECLDLLGSPQCKHTDKMLKLPVACLRAFQGTLAGGTACTVSQECISASCSLDCSATCCKAGACDRPPSEPNPIVVGGNCGEATEVCVDGAECNFPSSGAGPICMTGARLGEACDLPGAIVTPRTQVECVDNTICKPSSSPLGGTCMAPPSEGEPCDASEDVPCNSALDYCDPVSAKCVHRILPGKACLSGTECVFYAPCDSSTGKCIAGAGLGQACDESTGHICLGNLSCVGGVCVPSDPWPTCP